jgi:hypothetical protein
MLFIIRNEEELSKKTNFIVKLVSENSKNKIFYIFKKESMKFKEKWRHNYVQLASSNKGIIAYYLLMFLKSPKEFRDGIMSRLSFRNARRVLADKSFFSVLSSTLYLHFRTKARTNKLLQMLYKLKSPKVFLIDEFLSINCIGLKKLRIHGPIVYVSQDIAYNRYGFGDNFVTRKLMLRLERDALPYFDLVVVCSETERLKYLELGAKDVFSYPNIYPTKDFKPSNKDEFPSISIVLKDYWGSRSRKSLKLIFEALASLDRQIKVYMIGLTPEWIPKNVIMEYYDYIPSKSRYLDIINKSWIGINVGIHKAGTNERKYDYAEAETVVFSDDLGVRGDLFPHEHVFVDKHDLAAKIGQFIEFGKEKMMLMGKENRKYVLSLANKKSRKLLSKLKKRYNV